MTLTDRMREAYAAFNRRDFDALDDVFAEDIRWRVPAVLSPEIHGRDGVKVFMRGLAEQFSSHEITLDDAVEQDDRLICFVRHAFTRPDGGGGSVEAVHDWRFRDGKVVAMREVADTMAFAAAAGMPSAPPPA